MNSSELDSDIHNIIINLCRIDPWVKDMFHKIKLTDIDRENHRLMEDNKNKTN